MRKKTNINGQGADEMIAISKMTEKQWANYKKRYAELVAIQVNAVEELSNS